MRLRSGIGLAIAGAVCAVVAAVSWAGDGQTLKGDIERSGQATIRVSVETRKDGHRYRKTEYRFTELQVRCGEREREFRFGVSGGETVWLRYADRNPFGTVTISGPAGNPAVKTKVVGRLVTPRRARGFVRVSGSSVPLEGGGSARCDSGRLHWAAIGR